jgi:hypothetical protein
LVAAVPHATCAPRLSSPACGGPAFFAPLVLDGSTTGTAFHACIEHFVAPALKPGGVLVLDNLTGHSHSQV